MVEATIRQTLAETYEAIGAYDEAKTHAERAFALRKSHLGEDAVESIDSAAFVAWILKRKGVLKTSKRKLEELSAKAAEALGDMEQRP